MARLNSSARPMLEQYVKKILASRVYDVALETPLYEARILSRRLNNRVFLKREDLQPVFSFKCRGAYNKMVHLAPEALKRRYAFHHHPSVLPTGG